MSEAKPADPGHFFARVLADQHYQRGLQFEQQGEWVHALTSYRRACSLDPTSVLFLVARGHICQANGLEPEAEECYRVGLSLRPDDTVVLYNQAQLFAARGQLEEARCNLAKIVAGDVESLGDRAAPIFCRLGDIALRNEDYTAAAVHFRRARECTPEHRYAAAALAGLERFAEFAAPFQADGAIQPKIALYGYAGAMLLGMPEDDGIAIPPYPGLGFDSLEELAQTLARFVGLARRLRWPLETVVALDPESQPLAIALAAALSARPASTVETVPHGASALGVTATGANPAALAEQLAALRQRTPRTLHYAVGLARPVWDYSPMPHVASAAMRLEFPWNRGEASALEHAEAYGDELAGALIRLAAEPAIERQVDAQLAWHEMHPRLAFDVHTLDIPGRLPRPSGRRSVASGQEDLTPRPTSWAPRFPKGKESSGPPPLADYEAPPTSGERPREAPGRGH